MQQFNQTKFMTIPSLGFGTYKLTGNEGTQAVRTALDIGYRHIDTAQIYQNEAEVGKAIKESGVDRNAIFLTTKIWHENLKADDVRKSFEESLKKLQTDHVDLLLIHWPNPEVELKETIEAMLELQQKQQVKNIGVSNFPVALMQQAVEGLQAPIACNQVEYHVMLNQQPVLEYAQQHDMILTAYSPLAQGNLSHHDMLEQIAVKHNKHVSQIALRWLIQQKNVAAIPKSSKREHIERNFNIFDFTLDENDLREIENMTGNTRIVNPDFAPQWDQAA